MNTEALPRFSQRRFSPTFADGHTQAFAPPGDVQNGFEQVISATGTGSGVVRSLEIRYSNPAWPGCQEARLTVDGSP